MEILQEVQFFLLSFQLVSLVLDFENTEEDIKKAEWYEDYLILLEKGEIICETTNKNPTE